MSTHSEDTFPPELLVAPLGDRLAYFENWLVAHAKLKEAEWELVQAIRHTGDRRIIHLYGCTGTGKSTLRERVERVITEAALAEMERDPDAIPFASLIIPPPDKGPFDWRDVYVHTLQALGEPPALTSKKVPMRAVSVPVEKQALAPNLPRQQLRMAMVECLHRRSVKVLFYDEAQHFQNVTKAQSLEGQMDNLKWLADVTGTTIVLIGTYDLLNLIDLNGQLARRSASIHFARYHGNDSAEYKQFSSVVYAFQRHLPLAEVPDLVSHCDYLYDRSFGCVGILKDWLVSGLTVALHREENTLTAKQLEACVNFDKLVAVGRDAVAGDQRVHGVDVQAELKTLLASASSFPVPQKRPTTSTTTGKSSRKPGQRGATRDQVGSDGPDED